MTRVKTALGRAAIAVWNGLCAAWFTCPHDVDDYLYAVWGEPYLGTTWPGKETPDSPHKRS